jgi:hypothetical protein
VFEGVNVEKCNDLCRQDCFEQNNKLREVTELVPKERHEVITKQDLMALLHKIHSMQQQIDYLKDQYYLILEVKV